VTVKFVQGTCFKFFRSTICGNAPNSIFDHHFNLESRFNMTSLPNEYTLDRSDDIFKKYVDPILRGYKDIVINKDDRKMLESDLAFYNIEMPLEDGLIPYTSNIQFTDNETQMCKWIGKNVMIYISLTKNVFGHPKFELELEDDFELPKAFDLDDIPDEWKILITPWVSVGDLDTNLITILESRWEHNEPIPELGITMDIIRNAKKEWEDREKFVLLYGILKEPKGKMVMWRNEKNKEVGLRFEFFI
jgi:hypothetical protein